MEKSHKKSRKIEKREKTDKKVGYFYHDIHNDILTVKSDARFPTYVSGLPLWKNFRQRIFE